MVKEFEVRWEGELPRPPAGGVGRDHAARRRLAVEDRVRAAGRRRRAGADGGRRHGDRVGSAAALRHAHAARDEATGSTSSTTGSSRWAPGAVTYLRYVHRGVVPAEDYDRQLDACRRHTAFYYHSLGAVRAPLRGRAAATSPPRRPSRPPPAGFVAVRRALGLPDDVVAGDPVRLTPAGHGADRGRRRLRDGPVPRRAQRRRAVPRGTAATRGAGRSAWRTTCSPTASTRRRASGHGATWLDGVFADGGVA